MRTDPSPPDASHDALVLWLVWSSLMFSQFIFASVPVLIPAPPDYQAPALATGSPAAITLILGVVALIVLGALRMGRNKMYFDAARTSGFATREAARDAYFSMAMTSWVFCELIGIFGLMIAYLTYDSAQSLPFMGLAALAFVIFRPRPLDATPPGGPGPSIDGMSSA